MKVDYGSWKDGSSIFKDNKGYYIIQFDINKGKEYKKYLKNWKPPLNNQPLYLDKAKKKWTTQKTRLKKIKKTKKRNK
jgi:hypothetical protein